MNERKRFIDKYNSDLYTVTELAEEFEISRKTAYKWIKRYQQDGQAGLVEHSRAPLQSPQRIDAKTAKILLDCRKAHPEWGPKTIRGYLETHGCDIDLPAPSTIGDLFVHHGLSQKRPRRNRPAQAERRTIISREANQLWNCDFKGEFRMGDSSYCYPLTVTDDYSRMILGCVGQVSTNYEITRKNFTGVFERYGLPEAIRSDNGAPFAGQGPRRISRLNIWWLKLGISHVLSRPGCPQDNPRHERMHRHLKAETTRPPESDLIEQQGRFDRFVEQYNHVRPHQGIDLKVPAKLYQASARALPKQLPEHEYPGYYEQRRVDTNGMINFKGRRIFLSEVLGGETVALKEIADGIWSVYIYELLLARIDERDSKMH
jgi:transposase InsO family protein